MWQGLHRNMERRSGMSILSLTRRALLAGAAVTIAASSAHAADPIKVAAIYTVPVEQQWVSRIHKALNAAQARGDVQYVFSENVANTDYERVMREYAEAGNKLIVGEVFGVERAARGVAKDYPETAFLMGSSFGPEEPNFSVFDNYIQECSYLTGLVAGALTQSKQIGMVGGYPIPEVNRLMNAFMTGAKEMDPDVTFSVSFIGSWYDPPKAKEAAFAMIDQGADVLYAERFGVSDAAKERGVKAIGNVIDTRADYPGTVVASALWHMEPTINEALDLVREGSFKVDDYGRFSHMSVGGCTLADMDPQLVPADVVTKVRAKQAEIMSGKLQVAIDDTEPKSTR
jgi:basic membrane lipoprotein Med (substrate-binding protein (PBP1-ABC) superfamily)